MTDILATLRHLDDERLPAFSSLLTEAEPLLAAAVAEAGGQVMASRPRQVTWSPGRSATVRYDARVRWPGSDEVTDELFVGVTGRIPKGAFTLVSDDGEEVAVWRVPHDARLPGLSAVTRPGHLDLLLDDVGVERGDAAPIWRLVSYRPGRRAVVQATRGSTTVFLKIVRPRDAEALHRFHQKIRERLPVPASLGYDAEIGIVVLQGLGGTLLRRALNGRGPLPRAVDLMEVLDRLPDIDGVGSAPSWRTAEFADLLGRIRPEQIPQLQRLVEELGLAEEALDDPLVPVHGDFHEAQLLIDTGGAISGVLDVDTFTLGRRVDDLATMIGHLSTLAMSSANRLAIERYAARLLDSFDRVVDPVALRKSVAAVVVGLATGPFRVLEDRWQANTDARIALATRWLESADRVARKISAPAEKGLTPRSGPPQTAGAQSS